MIGIITSLQLPYKFKNDSDKDKENEKYCHICHRHGHTTDERFLNPRRKDIRNNKNPSNGTTDIKKEAVHQEPIQKKKINVQII